MKLILLQKVTNLGNLGDKVNVKPGFGRNFLVPQGKAVPATAANLAEFEARRAELEKAAADKLATAQGLAVKLESVMLTIARKAGVDGRLFGSVTNYDIAEALQAQGFEIEKSAIRMPEGPLKATGETVLEIALHTDVIANVKVQVVGEQ